MSRYLSAERSPRRARRSAITRCTSRALSLAALAMLVACARWGDNLKGQLGDGTNDDRLVPVDVLGL